MILFQAIKFSCLVLFVLLIRLYQVLPSQAIVDLGVMAVKEYSTYLKAPVSLEHHNLIV